MCPCDYSQQGTEPRGVVCLCTQHSPPVPTNLVWSHPSFYLPHLLPVKQIYIKVKVIWRSKFNQWVIQKGFVSLNILYEYDENLTMEKQVMTNVNKNVIVGYRSVSQMASMLWLQQLQLQNWLQDSSSY